MYFSTQNIANERTTITLKNTCAFLNVRLRLGPDFFNAKLLDAVRSMCNDSNFYFYNAPTINPHLYLIEASFPISGECFIDRTNPENPSLVIDPDRWNENTLGCSAGYPTTVCVDNSRPNTRHITNSLGILSIPTYDNSNDKTFQITLYAYLDLGQGDTLSTLITTPAKTTSAPIRRNHLYNLEINMTDSTSTTSITITDNYLSRHYSSKEARMQLLRNTALADRPTPINQ